jgi:hypothetical protein
LDIETQAETSGEATKIPAGADREPLNKGSTGERTDGASCSNGSTENIFGRRAMLAELDVMAYIDGRGGREAGLVPPDRRGESQQTDDQVPGAGMLLMSGLVSNAASDSE